MIPYNTKIWSYPLAQMETNWVKDKMPLPSKKDILMSLVIKQDPNQQRMPHTKFYYPMSGGVQAFIDSVAEPLNIKLAQPVQKIERLATGMWCVNGGDLYDRIISTIPLPLMTAAMRLPDQIANAIKGLKYNSLTTIFFSCPGNELTDLYIPEKRYRAHRICFSGNLAPDAAPAGKNCGGIEIIGPKFEVEDDLLRRQSVIPEELNAERILDSEFSPFAYVIHDLDYQKNTQAIREYFGGLENFDLLGRWGEWNYNNMDLCMRDGLQLGRRILGEI